MRVDDMYVFYIHTYMQKQMIEHKLPRSYDSSVSQNARMNDEIGSMEIPPLCISGTRLCVLEYIYIHISYILEQTRNEIEPRYSIIIYICT
jgi:hypothetical protein